MRIHETADPFANKKQILHNFVQYWKEHSAITAVTEIEQDMMFDKAMVDDDGSINVNCKVHLHDDKATKLPFKFGNVSEMRLDMPNLQTLENTPRVVKGIFGIESFIGGLANTQLKTMAGGPQRAGHMAFEFNQSVENLQTSLTQPIESIWIGAPEILSFAGFNTTCNEMSILVPLQKSISGIHKQLRGVNYLHIVLPDNFDGGLLGLAMISGIKGIGGSGGSTRNHKPHEKAIRLISQGVKSHKNVHEIQEDLIDAGLRKFATL